MRRAVGFAGPVLLAAGAWLAAPRPHAWIPQEFLLGLVGLVLVLGLVGVGWGRQLAVAVALVLALVPTFPTVVPMAWPGAIAIVLGAALSLEGARTRREGVSLPTLRAWVFPLSLLAFSLLGVLVALTTNVGRESLDITQGMGVAVSVPFLLAAAWAGLAALERRDRESSGLLPFLLAGVALTGGAVLVAADPVTAQQNPCEDPRSASGFEDCPTVSHVLAEEEFATNVTQTTWELSSDEALFIDPGFHESEVSNMTFEDAGLEVEINSQPLSGCADATLVVQRAVGPWDDDTNLSVAPEGTDPVTAPISEQACNFGGPVPVDVGTHFQAWADGAPLEGWRIELGQGGPLQGGQGPYGTNATYATNGPHIEDVDTEPAPTGPVTMAPVGEVLTVTLNVSDADANPRNASLTVDGQQAHQEPLPGTGTIPLTFAATETNANGTLQATVRDWDGNNHTATVTELRPDREAPQVDPEPPLVSTEDGFELEDPVPEDEPVAVTVNVSDDACFFADPCTNVTLFDEDGQPLQNATTNRSSPEVNLSLPTSPPGERAVIVQVEDAADRVNATLLTYAVSEPRPPTLSNLTVTDLQGREDRQEAGLPLQVSLDAHDESLPIRATASRGDTEVANATLENASGTIELAPVLETPGTRTLIVEVEDRWGNAQQVSRLVEIHPRRAPTIELPTDEYVPSEARLSATVADASVSPENASVSVIRGGTQLEVVNVEKTLTEDGVDVVIRPPELLHGEPLRVSITATDALGQFATGTGDYEVDAIAPEITVEPEPGATIDGDVWTLANGTLFVGAEDGKSGVETLHLLDPLDQALDPTGHTIPMADVGEDRILVEAQDRVGNVANWTGTIRLDRNAPVLDLDVDGHELVVTVGEAGSGIATLGVEADDGGLPVPNVPGEHRVTVPNVRRGDTVDVLVTARDRVGHEALLNRTVTIQDAPPEVFIGPLEDRNVTLSTSDADGDAVSTEAELVHRVNGTTWAFPRDADEVTLPSWRGDVALVVDATANETTVTENRTFTLGEPPHVHATLPRDVEPGARATVDVTWERDYDSVTLVVQDEGRQVALANVTETGSGQGQAELELPEGTYDLELRAQHPDGTVDTASAGAVSVEEGTSALFLAVGLLLLTALVGVIVLSRYRDEDEEETPPEGARPGSP